MEHWVKQILVVLPLLLLIFLLFLSFWPVDTRSFQPDSHISKDHQDSVRRINELRRRDGPEVADYGHAILLTHGHKVDKAIVMYHGYTNCPRQYEKLAKQFFDRGYNVYVPRLAHHGLKDLMTERAGKLTLEQIVSLCKESVDIARGLGYEVSVLGISMGGVMAAWNAQFSQNIDTVVVIVPSFGWYFAPGVVKPLINLAYVSPNLLLWWDPIKKEKRVKPYSMYHRFSTRVMGHIMRLGLSVTRAARLERSKAKRIIVLTNERDKAVDEVSTKRLIRAWRSQGAHVAYYQFPQELKMDHDIIDPLHPYDQTDVVYSKIFELLDEYIKIVDYSNR